MDRPSYNDTQEIADAEKLDIFSDFRIRILTIPSTVTIIKIEPLEPLANALRLKSHIFCEFLIVLSLAPLSHRVKMCGHTECHMLNHDRVL
jgi:hypothetical protein